jgi:hypothetical protein
MAPEKAGRISLFEDVSLLYLVGKFAQLYGSAKNKTPHGGFLGAEPAVPVDPG